MYIIEKRCTGLNVRTFPLVSCECEINWYICNKNNTSVIAYIILGPAYYCNCDCANKIFVLFVLRFEWTYYEWNNLNNINSVMHIRHKKYNMIETLPRNLLSVAFWTNLIFYLHISDVFSAVFRQIFRTIIYL